MTDDFLWVEKYRPKVLDDFVGNDELRNTIRQFIENGDIPHLLFSGPPGTGKTTLAKIIINSIDCDVLYINASDENSVDVMRTKIKDFLEISSFDDNLKVVVLEEFDYASRNFQAALRGSIEQYSRSSRFIMTCNYVERVTEPIMSRVQHFKVVPQSKGAAAKNLARVLTTEGVQFEMADLKVVVDTYYPDIRKILNESQLRSGTGKLVVDSLTNTGIDTQVIDILVSNSKDKLTQIRQLFADAETKDFTSLYRALYDRVLDYAPDNVGQAIVIIADGQYRDSLVVDKEINMAATIHNLIEGTVS